MFNKHFHINQILSRSSHRSYVTQNKKILRILSIDGGGSRGLIPALFLEKLEKDTGRKIADHFHLIIGTSTGGIIATGLTKPKPLTGSEIVDLYQEKGKDIFPSGLNTSVVLPKYSNAGLKKLLGEYFGNTKLSDIKNSDSKTALMVSSFCLENNEPYFFRSWKAEGTHLDKGEDMNDFDYYLKDVALATSAAPTYFPIAKISNVSGKKTQSFIDGGVVANNPAVCAIAAGLAIYPESKGHNIFLVSLGTGKKTDATSLLSKINFGGTLGWGPLLIDLLFTGSASMEEYQMNRFLSIRDNYYRFQIDNFNPKLDDVSKETIGKMRQRFFSAIDKEWKEDYDNLKKELATERVPWDYLVKTLRKDGTTRD